MIYRRTRDLSAGSSVPTDGKPYHSGRASVAERFVAVAPIRTYGRGVAGDRRFRAVATVAVFVIVRWDAIRTGISRPQVWAAVAAVPVLVGVSMSLFATVPTTGIIMTANTGWSSTRSSGRSSPRMTSRPNPDSSHIARSTAPTARRRRRAPDRLEGRRLRGVIEPAESRSAFGAGHHTALSAPLEPTVS